MSTAPEILSSIAKQFVGRKQDDLNKTETNIVRMLCIHEYLAVDGKGGFETVDNTPPNPVAAGVVCKCPADVCPMHGRISKSEARHGRRVRE